MNTSTKWLSPLVATRAPSKNNPSELCWRIVEPLIFDSETAGVIIVEAGFETDFASVPRIPLAYLLFGDTAHAAAVVHDFLCSDWYRLCFISWKQAAAVFLEAMLASGVPRWRAYPMYLAVRLAPQARPTPCKPQPKAPRHG